MESDQMIKKPLQESRERRSVALVLVLMMAGVIVPVAADPLPAYNYIFIEPVNGAAHDFYGNGTYEVHFRAPGAGTNAHHITTDTGAQYGQTTVEESPNGSAAGTLYLTDTGGGKYADDCILAIAVNGTVGDDFRLRIRTSGYDFPPNMAYEEAPPDEAAIHYIADAVDVTLTKADFTYGPQNWRPSGETTPYPLWAGQDMTETTDQFLLMFVDTRVGTISPVLYAGLTDTGATRVDFAVSGLDGYLAFDSYEYLENSKPGNGVHAISWTNAMPPKASSGYLVKGEYRPPAPVAAFSVNATNGAAPFTVQFTDASTGTGSITYAWDFQDDGTVDSTEQNPTFTYSAAGNYTVNLTVTNAGGSDSEVRAGYITVGEAPTPTPTPTVTPIPGGVLPDYNNIFVGVANDAGPKYDAFANGSYNIRFEGYDRGLNALHVSTDPAVNFGQVTTTASQSGTFYATDSGGKGYEDDILLLVAVNGTVPDDFRLHVTADGYTWTPNPIPNQAPTSSTYSAATLDETFTKDDLVYGPQTWKPTGNGFDYPIYFGQDMGDAANTFKFMFVDLNAGVLRPNAALQNQGAVRINYSFENLDTFASFSVYGYCQTSNNGDDMVAWTNSLLAAKAPSGYAVTAPAVPAVVQVPTGTGIPTDTNGDGLYDDVNGNRRRDFGDIVLYFNQMTCIAANEPIAAFDCNGNGRIDFADVVWFFNHI